MSKSIAEKAIETELGISSSEEMKQVVEAIRAIYKSAIQARTTGLAKDIRATLKGGKKIRQQLDDLQLFYLTKAIQAEVPEIFSNTDNYALVKIGRVINTLINTDFWKKLPNLQTLPCLVQAGLEDLAGFIRECLEEVINGESEDKLAVSVTFDRAPKGNLIPVLHAMATSASAEDGWSTSGAPKLPTHVPDLGAVFVSKKENNGAEAGAGGGAVVGHVNATTPKTAPYMAALTANHTIAQLGGWGDEVMNAEKFPALAKSAAAPEPTKTESAVALKSTPAQKQAKPPVVPLAPLREPVADNASVASTGSDPVVRQLTFKESPATTMASDLEAIMVAMISMGEKTRDPAFYVKVSVMYAAVSAATAAPRAGAGGP